MELLNENNFKKINEYADDHGDDALNHYILQGCSE